MWHKKTKDLHKLLSWQSNSISSPLLKFIRYPSKDGLSVFKQIQQFMGDKEPILQDNSEVGVSILNLAVLTNEIRDEVYCQICKQVTLNPSIESCYKGWDLLSLCCQHFPPSKELNPFLYPFIEEYHTVGNEKLQTYSKFCIRHLKRIEKDGARNIIPTANQIRMLQILPFVTPIFGSKLEDIMAVQKLSNEGNDYDIPKVLVKLTEDVFRLGGFRTEGIFRVPGDSLKVSDLRLQIEHGDYECKFQDPHVPASTLKYWLRELEDPLIPAEFYDGAIECAQNEDIDGSLDLISKIPELNQKVVKFLIKFIRKLSEPDYVVNTKMNVSNLSMVFAPSFLRSLSLNPTIIMTTQKFQQNFVFHIISKLDCI